MMESRLIETRNKVETSNDISKYMNNRSVEDRVSEDCVPGARGRLERVSRWRPVLRLPRQTLLSTFSCLPRLSVSLSTPLSLQPFFMWSNSFLRVHALFPLALVLSLHISCRRFKVGNLHVFPLFLPLCSLFTPSLSLWSKFSVFPFPTHLSHLLFIDQSTLSSSRILSPSPS